ncbi:cytochrome c-type biogenesis protein CcmH [Roseateles sp. YR242]|uniref:cytochrome c-type biogenesis protein n=1 Tax=Roseateles sp. YR242 TaxID=1855305 RepID=UPI0008B2090B|nr:cytochrome c-type biogenesis protein CcmH [Roseateles sp. YR242]
MSGSRPLRMSWRWMVGAMMAALWIGSVPAATPAPSGDTLAAREFRLAHELRCVVCQNQSLAESNAPLAADMRTVIREQLQAGRSDAQVIAFFEQRYGAFVSYTPPWRPSTWLLWLGPFLIALTGLVVLVRALRRHQATDIPPTPQDQERLQRFLGERRVDESIAP